MRPAPSEPPDDRHHEAVRGQAEGGASRGPPGAAAIDGQDLAADRVPGHDGSAQRACPGTRPHTRPRTVPPAGWRARELRSARRRPAGRATPRRPGPRPRWRSRRRLITTAGRARPSRATAWTAAASRPATAPMLSTVSRRAMPRPGKQGDLEAGVGHHGALQTPGSTPESGWCPRRWPRSTSACPMAMAGTTWPPVPPPAIMAQARRSGEQPGRSARVTCGRRCWPASRRRSGR